MEILKKVHCVTNFGADVGVTSILYITSRDVFRHGYQCFPEQKKPTFGQGAHEESRFSSQLQAALDGYVKRYEFLYPEPQTSTTADIYVITDRLGHQD